MPTVNLGWVIVAGLVVLGLFLLAAALASCL
jgi:hypothetical protein